MTDLPPAEIAFRVGLFAGAIGVLGWLPPSLGLMAAVVLAILSLVFFYEIWVARASRRAQRDAAIWAVAALGGAVAMYQGWAVIVSTPLLVLAVICIGLWFAGTLGDSGGGDSESETLH